MSKILVATEKPFAKKAVEEIRKVIEGAGFQLELLEKYGNPNDLVKAVSNVDALVVRSDKVTKEVLEAGKNLKIVVRAGAGYDNVDIETATSRKIIVMNTPGQNSNAVAELAVGMMVFMARGNFRGVSGTELKGKNLGIHAYGYVGKIVAEIAKGFGMNVFAFDPYVSKETMDKDRVNKINTVEELYYTCQYISLHVPATVETKASINYNLLSKLPKGATLVNTARKEVVCEDSLKRIFAERDDFKYISDIMPSCHEELLKYENRYYSTPKKQGAETSEANINAGIAAARQIVNYINSGDKTFQVNK